LNQDVLWIITDEERKAFMMLSNDEERENFIESFWQRRDPTPDTAENEFKEEHYRASPTRMNIFPPASLVEDRRGRIYTSSAADEIESHPSGGQYERSNGKGGGPPRPSL